MEQQAIITIKDLGNGSLGIDTEFKPEVKGQSFSPAVALWKVLMDAAKAESRSGDWMSTYTSKKFYPTDPKSDDVCIEDIAHALSMIPRFGGHTLSHYSVAQHSVHVSYLVTPTIARLGLMHDSPEAYLGDMVHPLKMSMPRFRDRELVVWSVIATKFGLPTDDPSDNPILKAADIKACMTERRDLLPPTTHKWSDEYEATTPDEALIVPLPQKAAEALFLARFAELNP